MGHLQDPVVDQMMPRAPNDGTVCGRPRDVSHTCFLNSTLKQIKLTVIGYSRLYCEL